MKTLTLSKPCLFFIGLALLLAVGSIGLAQENPPMLLKIRELKSGLKLRYTLSLPRQYSPSQSYPLVVALHYGGKVTPFYSKDFMASLVEPALRDLDAIITAPDCPASGWTNSVSEAAILELVLLLMKEYTIDSDRILILGYSMGGSGAWHMASRHPALFSAAIPISAPAETATMPVIADIPLYVIHGELDELVPAQEIKKLCGKQKMNGAEIKLIIVKGASHYQLARFVNPLKASIPWIRNIWEMR